MYYSNDDNVEIPFSVVSFRETFDFRMKINKMFLSGENYMEEEKKEEERVQKLIQGSQKSEQADVNDNQEKEDFGDEDDADVPKEEYFDNFKNSC